MRILSRIIQWQRLLLLLFVVQFNIVDAFSYDFEVDGIFYEITSEGNLEVCVTYEDLLYKPANYSGDIAIPSNVSHGGKTYKVTSIGQLAFHECVNLTSISFPNTIQTIGRNAFYK